MGFLKRAVNNLTLQTPPPQGVAMSKIAEINVTTGVQSVTFSGLNGNADRLYWLVGWNLGVTGANNFLMDIQFNGDTNSAHYVTLRFANQNGSMGFVNPAKVTTEPGLATLSFWGTLPIIGNIDYHIHAASLQAAGYVVLLGWESELVSGGTYNDCRNTGWWQPGSGVTNLTSITLYLNNASALWAVGSHFELWAQRSV